MKMPINRQGIYYASVFFWTACSLFLLGFGLVAPQLDSGAFKTAQAASETSVGFRAPETAVKGHPTQILIPRLGIDLNIIDGTYFPVNQTWTLSKDSVQYATMTAEPNNQSGTTFMYGHNTTAVFKRLPELTPQDKVIVKTDNDHTFVYQLRSMYRVKPQQTEVLTNSKEPTLLLQTCSGLWNEWRTMAELRLTEVR